MIRFWLIAAALILFIGVLLASMVRIVPADQAAGRPVAATEVADSARPLAPATPDYARISAGWVLPVAGFDPAALTSSFGDAREGGLRRHEGIDMAARSGTPVLAVTDGTIEKLSFSAAGGITLYQRSADRRWMFYYGHLGGYAPEMRERRAVRAGEAVGYVGDTGNAGAGQHHLHFEARQIEPGAPWNRGVPVDPHPLLAAAAARR